MRGLAEKNLCLSCRLHECTPESKECALKQANTQHQRDYYAKNKDKVAQHQRDYRAKNKDKVAQHQEPQQCAA